MAKLEPVAAKSRPSLRVVPVAPDPATTADPRELAAWERAALGLRHYLGGFIARVVLLIASFMLAQGPIGRDPNVQLVALLLVAASGVVMLSGLIGLQRMPARADARTPARVALALTMVMILCDLLGLGAVAFAPELRAAAIVGDAAAWVASTAFALVALRRIFADLDATAKPGKTTGAAIQLALYASFATFASVIATSSESELAWLALPAGAATALVGVSLFVSLLWLLSDARVAILDWQTRVRRAHAPDAREAGDPEP